MSLQLSPHFTLAEAIASNTAIRLSIDNTPSSTVIANMTKSALQLEKVRTLLAAPIVVSSWFRCLLLNRAIGSGDSSAHRQGWAIDFTCQAFGTPKQVADAIIKSGIKFDQLIWEGSWVHISFAPTMRGQILTAVFRAGKRTTYLPGIQ